MNRDKQILGLKLQYERDYSGEAELRQQIIDRVDGIAGTLYTKHDEAVNLTTDSLIRLWEVIVARN